MEGGYKVSPRYTINGDPKRIKGWQVRSAKNEEELQALFIEAANTLQYFKDKGTATEHDVIRDFIVIPPKGRIIFDIDMKGDKNGLDNWRNLLSTYSINVEPLLCVKTKSGGFHYYFDIDVDYVKTLANLAGYLGVDIRGQRGHVVLPTRVGPLETWQQGEYLLYKGDPREKHALFPISRISKAFVSTDDDLWLVDIKDKIKKKQPIEFIPAGMRDSVIWEACCILYRSGVTRTDADKYMADLCNACESTNEMPVHKIAEVANEKLARVYKHDRNIVTVIDLERELALGGLVQIINDGPTKYFFEHSNLFGLDKMSIYGKEAMCDVLKKHRIIIDDGEKTKIRGGDDVFRRYVPDTTVYGLGLYPDIDVRTFNDEHNGQTLYNTYSPSFTIDSAQEYSKGTEDFYPLFIEFLQFLHPHKWEEMLNRIAWTVQFPQLKSVSLSVFVSSTQGVGKDVLCDLHGLLVGLRHYRRLNSIEELTSRFTDLGDVLLLNIAEVQMGRGLSARNRITEVRGLLKTLVTSSVIKSERKNIQASFRTNYTNFVMTSNEFHPNLLEDADRRHEIFIFPSTKKLDQAKFGRLADLSNPRNYPSGSYPWDSLATIWWGLKNHKITKRYHIDSANDDDDKRAIYDEGISHIQAWLLTELPDVVSKDFIAWFISSFYPQRDKVRPIDEADYFFRECKKHIEPIRNGHSKNNQPITLTQIPRLTVVGDRLLDLQKRKVSRGAKDYYQYLFTIRNHGEYDSQTSDFYNNMMDEVIRHYKTGANVLDTNTADLDKLMMKFRLKSV